MHPSHATRRTMGLVKKAAAPTRIVGRLARSAGTAALDAAPDRRLRYSRQQIATGD